jgi:hypothetical protein
MDPLARKQLLLTRIALDRVELRVGVTRVRQAVGVPLLLRALVGGDVGRALFSGSGKTAGADWLRLGLSLLRRYRLAATVIAGIAPLLGRRKGWRRMVRLAAFGAVAWFGWRALQRRGDDGP